MCQISGYFNCEQVKFSYYLMLEIDVAIDFKNFGKIIAAICNPKMSFDLCLLKNSTFDFEMRIAM